MTFMLLIKVLREDDLVELLGPRPYAKIVDYDTFVDAFEKDRQQRTKKSPSSPEPKSGPEKDKPGMLSKHLYSCFFPVCAVDVVVPFCRCGKSQIPTGRS